MSEIIQLDAPGGNDPDVTFASVDDVLHRIGRASFDSGETTRVQVLLALVGQMILDEVGRTDAWAVENVADDVPRSWRTASIEAVARILQNPRGVRSQQEALGAHSHSETFADATAQLELTKGEIARCKRALGLNGVASARMPGILDRVGPMLGTTGEAYSTEEDDET